MSGDTQDDIIHRSQRLVEIARQLREESQYLRQELRRFRQQLNEERAWLRRYPDIAERLKKKEKEVDSGC